MSEALPVSRRQRRQDARAQMLAVGGQEGDTLRANRIAKMLEVGAACSYFAAANAATC